MEYPSSDVKSSARTNGEQDYIKREINNIIAEARQNNQYVEFLNENRQYLLPQGAAAASSGQRESVSDNNHQHDDESENDYNSQDSSYISDKYLNSNYDDQSKMMQASGHNYGQSSHGYQQPRLG